MAESLNYPERVALARLHALLELLPTALDQRLSEAGVTTFEHTLLGVLAESSGGFMRMSEIARKTNATLPRVSRVVTSLERRGLIERLACPEDRRATNIALTTRGTETHDQSQRLYASAVRELVLEGLGRLPGSGVDQLADLSYAILSTLDTEHPRRAVFAGDPAPECAADPTTTCDADPAQSGCDADPADTSETLFAADPQESAVVPCDADPAQEQLAAS